jgi:hypothetical protein
VSDSPTITVAADRTVLNAFLPIVEFPLIKAPPNTPKPHSVLGAATYPSHLTCPRCANKMRVIALINDNSVIRHILQQMRKYDPRPPGGQKIRYLPRKWTST